ncbi:D-alanyl-D-alanine carboxypeptidase family protein [Roseibium sediminis]|uniref:D-alanyl-D-alanine carboxypeptidase family protein n=1 Tax=Roseibium sediminis TaxID=1775174 RepID=UPI001AD8E182|nr:D-alanyl-D-alanine carboxypeptidase family protein [Roseibium sediminis]
MTSFRVFSQARFGLPLIIALFLFLLPISARADIGAYILIDADSGAVLDQSDATRQWYPASLTKIMTAYVTFKAIRQERISLSSAVVQSKNSLSEPPSKMGFKVGTQLTVENALKIILVKSANDIAVALGEAVGGSEEAFIQMMNAEAQRLGMTGTRFSNPHGLPDNSQVTSARDLAILAQAFWRDFPEARSFYRHPGIQFGKKSMRSANREYLLRVPGANGMKTGYICNSGYNVAATATRGGRTLIAVILGAGSGLERIAFTRELMDKGFKKGRSGTKVQSLAGRGGPPPADGYCKRNKKPDVDTIMARFDMKSEKKSFFMAFAPTKDPGGVLRPGAGTSGESAADEDSITLPNGKTDWEAVLDRTIGTQKLAYQPVQVVTGVSAAAAAVAAASSSVVPESVPVANVPLPTAKPRLAGAAPVQNVVATPSETSGNQPETVSPAYGSLFRKDKGFAIPIPAPSPK